MTPIEDLTEKKKEAEKDKKAQNETEIWEFTYKVEDGAKGSKDWRYTCKSYHNYDASYYIIDGEIMMEGPRYEKMIILGTVDSKGTVKSFKGMDNQSSVNGVLNMSAGTGSGDFFVKKGSDSYDCSGTWAAKRTHSLTNIQRIIIDSRPRVPLTP